MHPGITIRVLSHNRRDFLVQTLDSAFAQTEPFDTVELYDNGSDFPVRDLAALYPALHLFALPRPVPVLDNVRRAFTAAPANPWLCVFHDDDLLHPDFCRKTRAAILRHPGISAVSCNGEVIDSGGARLGPLLPGLAEDRLLAGPAELARWYCESFIPFPVVVYRWDANFGADKDFAKPYGRCGDVAFLSRIVQRAPILIRAARDFSYRRHGGQSSAGFLWWEESKRWQLQLDLCQGDPAARRYVQDRRNARLTSRWLNAWLRDEPRTEPWDWAFFSLAATHRFFRNQKLPVFRRIFRFGGT